MQIIFITFAINVKKVRNTRDLKQGLWGHLIVGIIPIH